MITIVYAGLLGLLYVALSAYVVMGRYKYRVSLGTGDSEDLATRVRVHGNFAEYVPFALLLLLLVDYCEYAAWVIHALGCSLLAGRILHAVALTQNSLDVRKIAMLLTFGMIIVSSILLIWHYVAIKMTGF